MVCDQRDTAPVWGYILRQQGLIVILETSLEKAIDRWSSEMPDLVVIDIDIAQEDHMELYKKFRAVSVAPILLFLPAHHETQILEAYAAGVDEVVVKPISPAIFLAKIMAWVRRSWIMPMDELSLVKAGKHRLDPTQRCIVDSEGLEIKLTNLEFRLLHLLMSRPGICFQRRGYYPIASGVDMGTEIRFYSRMWSIVCAKRSKQTRAIPCCCKPGREAILFKGKAEEGIRPINWFPPGR